MLSQHASDKNNTFEPDQPAVIKLSSDDVQKVISMTNEIQKQYPLSQEQKQELEKLTSTNESLSAEEWKQLKLPGEPLLILRCSLKSQKVQVPGRMLLSRSHLVFIGQVLGSKVFVIRRLCGFTQAPEFD